MFGFDDVKNEVERAKSLEKWAKRCTHHFTKKTKRLLFEEIDNMMWSGCESVITGWCKRNRVYDEITDDEIQEIWNNEDPEDGKPVRLNGKYVWEAAKRVCDFINEHDDIIHIATFGEYKCVMKKVMMVIMEAFNVERKRRQTSRMMRGDDAETRT